VFPAQRLYDVIDGRADVAAHAPRDMPIWGDEFRGRVPDLPRTDSVPLYDLRSALAHAKIIALVDYMNRIQRSERHRAPCCGSESTPSDRVRPAGAPRKKTALDSRGPKDFHPKGGGKTGESALSVSSIRASRARSAPQRKTARGIGHGRRCS
jgi:hypothetical protein